ncbi:hypothetical protein Tco_0525003 [Tanacetum coccineum]
MILISSPTNPFLRPCNSHHIRVETTTTTQTLLSLQNPNVDNCDEKPIRIIPGAASIVQEAKLHKITNIREGGEEFVMSTQEYIRKVVEDVGENEDFTRGPWVSAVELVNVNGGIMIEVVAACGLGFLEVKAACGLGLLEVDTTCGLGPLKVEVVATYGFKSLHQIIIITQKIFITG